MLSKYYVDRFGVKAEKGVRKSINVSYCVFNFLLISFLFLHKSLCYGYSFEVPRRGTSNEYPQHRFLWRNKKNIMWITPLICSYVKVSPLDFGE